MWVRLIRYGLLAVFLVAAILFLGNAGYMTANYFFQFNPGKLSAEFQSTVLFAGIHLVVGILSFLLFVGLLRRRRWFVALYWVALIIWLTLLGVALWPYSMKHPVSDSLFVFVVNVLPIVLGLYLLRKSKEILAAS
jgi:hypothetical protein